MLCGIYRLLIDFRQTRNNIRKKSHFFHLQFFCLLVLIFCGAEMSSQNLNFEQSIDYTFSKNFYCKTVALIEWITA